jgi:hypothetical protein
MLRCATSAIAAIVLLTAPATAQRRAYPRTYIAPRASEPVVIDGIVDDEAWLLVPWSRSYVDIRGSAWPPPAHDTRMKILWDDDFLYVAAVLSEPHLWATLLDRDAIIYHDDDFEVFLDPDGDGMEYYELEINALGTEFDLFLDKPYREGGQAEIPWDMPGLETAVSLDGTLNDPTDVDVGWSVEIAIPWVDLRPTASVEPGTPPRIDDVWRVNFSRVDWPLRVVDGAYEKVAEATPENPHPEHNWVWSPQGEINMHIPDRWGRLWFVDRTPNGEER